jgi:hypothetical protein
MNELPDEENVPIEARHTWRGLKNWLKKNRWDRDIPDTGIDPNVKFHQCSESCKLHDQMK